MKKSIYFLLALLCLCFTAALQVQAQTPATATTKGNGSITGMLIDSLSGKPVEYATVSLLRAGSSQSIDGTLTDAQGRFSFPNLEAGVYNIAISFIGYNTKTINSISITEGAPARALGKVQLSPAQTQLKEVNVQALRPTITQEADRMVVSIEGTALAAGKTAYDVLATSPGVFVDQEGNIQLNGRSGVTVMLDGKLTYLSARDLRTMLEGMSAENIKNIEIITNPSAKYDAEGSSGILNINLKKNTLQGLNGSVYGGGTYNFKQYGFTTGGNLNYKSGKWNSFINLDMARRVGGREATFTRVFFGENSTTYFDQIATGNFVVQGPPSVRLGSDYALNDKHSIGFMANYTYNKFESDFLTDTYLGSTPNQPQLYIEANNYSRNSFQNLTNNLHYNYKIDTLGTMLSADLDYVKIRSDGESDFFNYYDSLATSKPVREDFLYTETPNGFDIYAVKVDFTKPLSKGQKLELGGKASRVVSDSDSRFYFNNDGLELDTARTNYFLYAENIYAGYVNWSGKLGEKFTLQAGLRAEQTVSRGESVTTKQIKNRDYLNFFPSLFLQQNVSDNYQVNYSYSRRLQRPNYGNLNPFFAYRDPYTYWLGNPDLRAQYTHAFGLTQTFKKTYSLVLNYQIVQDVIAEIPVLVVEDATTIYTVGNADNSYNLSMTANVPFQIMKNWDTQNTLIVSYDKYKTMFDKQQAVNEQVFYMLQSSHNILLPKDFKMEMNMAYRGPGAYALYEVDSQWWINVGFKKSFLNEKLVLSLNANDIFKGQRIKIATVGDQINEFDQYFRSRNVGMTLRYNFSRGAKFDTKQRNNKLEELNRTGG